MPRKITKGIYVTHLSVPSDPRMDITDLDLIHVRRRYFGCNVHYLIKEDGTIELGRHPMTISTFGPRRHNHSHIVVGVVGGRDRDTGKRAYGCTDAQRNALETLYQALSNALQVPLEIEEWIEKEDTEVIAEEAAAAQLEEDMATTEAMNPVNYQ